MCIPVDNFDDLEHETEAVGAVSRGPGDPDAHGYPGDNNDEGVTQHGTRENTAKPFWTSHGIRWGPCCQHQRVPKL